MSNPDRRHPRFLYRDQRLLLSPRIELPKPAPNQVSDEIDELKKDWKSEDEVGHEQLVELRSWWGS